MPRWPHLQYSGLGTEGSKWARNIAEEEHLGPDELPQVVDVGTPDNRPWIEGHFEGDVVAKRARGDLLAPGDTIQIGETLHQGTGRTAPLGEILASHFISHLGWHRKNFVRNSGSLLADLAFQGGGFNSGSSHVLASDLGNNSAFRVLVASLGSVREPAMAGNKVWGLYGSLNTYDACLVLDPVYFQAQCIKSGKTRWEKEYRAGLVLILDLLNALNNNANPRDFRFKQSMSFQSSQRTGMDRHGSSGSLYFLPVVIEDKKDDYPGRGGQGFRAPHELVATALLARDRGYPSLFAALSEVKAKGLVLVYSGPPEYRMQWEADMKKIKQGLVEIIDLPGKDDDEKQSHIRIFPDASQVDESVRVGLLLACPPLTAFKELSDELPKEQEKCLEHWEANLSDLLDPREQRFLETSIKECSSHLHVPKPAVVSVLAGHARETIAQMEARLEEASSWLKRMIDFADGDVTTSSRGRGRQYFDQQPAPKGSSQTAAQGLQGPAETSAKAQAASHETPLLPQSQPIRAD